MMKMRRNNMVRDDFAIFILSHGRADTMLTVDTLTKLNYTGKYYIICDDEDSDLEKYKENFGKDKVVVFSKADAIKKFDIMDNFPGKGVPTFARNMLYDIGKKLNLKYFLEFEDDYIDIRYRDVNINQSVKSLDKIIDPFLEFLDTRDDINTIAFLQGGDLIGGLNYTFWKLLSRKAMNTFFCRVDRPFRFEGRFNDDVNSYLHYGKVGKLYFSYSNLVLIQPQTQSRKGGITEAYKSFGTYVKSFYSVMLEPSCCKIAAMGLRDQRIHHQINWKNAVPKILNEKWKKK